MTDNLSDARAAVDALLKERAQYEEWLAKLRQAPSSSPAQVRQRVQADYEERLRNVIGQLRGHTATIAGDLERHRASLGELERKHRLAEETLAEAELRHAVGEYSSKEFQKLSGETNRQLEGLNGELTQVRSEISRLVEVQGQITRSPGSGPAAAPAPPSPPVAAPPAPPKLELSVNPLGDFESDHPAPAAQVGAPRFVPKPGSPSREVVPAPAIVRPVTSHSAPAPPLAAAPAPARRASDQGAEPGVPSDDTAERRVRSSPMDFESPAETLLGGAPKGKAKVIGGGSTSAKTLKCNECGSMNRPSEWYCERCGAELTAI